jgi:Listeria-Bacteroides repeat domain (List_Bact_rpt).
MNKKTKITAVLLAVVIALICASVFVACNKDSQSQGAKVLIGFDANDGSEIHAESVDPKNITYVPNARVGYDFAGWTMDKDGNEPLDPSKIRLGTTLYAQWKIKTFSVSFYVGDTLVKTTTVEYGKAAVAPTEERIADCLEENEIFVGWNGDFSSVTSDLAIYANTTFKETTYTVNFVVEGNVVKTASGKAGNTIVLPQTNEYEDKIPTGFVFAKWVDENGKEIESDAKYAKDATYTATYALQTPSAPEINVLYPQDKTSFVYGDVCNASINKDIAPSGITYVYEWFDENGNALASTQDNTACAIENVQAGDKRISVKVTASKDGYTSVSATAYATIKVEKATLTAIIDDINVVYGQDLPEYTLRFNGFKYGENESVVNKSNATVSTTYSKGSGVGAYAITLSGLVASNYNIIGENGAITATINVDKKALTIKDSVAFEKAYDGTPLSATLSNESINGLLDGDTATLKVETKGNVPAKYENESVPVSLTVVDKDGNVVSSNYELTANVVATITPAAIVYTQPSDIELTYNLPMPKIEGVAVNTENCKVLYKTSNSDDEAWSADVPTLVNAGEYTVYFQISRQHYKTEEGSFTVTINKAKQTLDGKQYFVTYGEEFTKTQDVTYVLGQEIKFALSCEYKAGNSARTYDIKATAEENPNVELTITNCTLTVNRATLVIEMKDKTITYGDAFVSDYSIVTANGLFAGDDIKDVIALETNYSQGNGIGKYQIDATLTDSASKNYCLNTSPNTSELFVEKKTATLTIEGKSVIFGDVAPSFTATIDGLYGNDEIEYTLSCGYKPGSGVRRYPISANVPEASDAKKNANYIVNVNSDAYLIVEKKPIALTVQDATVVYGNAAPTFTYTTDTPFVESDVPSITLSCSYKQGAKVGTTYAITPTITGNVNYEYTLTTGTLTVTKRAVVIEHEDHNFAFNDGAKASFDVAGHVKDAFESDVFGGSIQTTSGNIAIYVANGALGEDFEFATPLSIVNKDGENVEDCYVVTYRLTVEIKEITIAHTVRNLTNQVYDGNAHEVYVEVEEGTSVTYIVNGIEQTGRPSFVDAGEYVVSFRLTKEGATPYEGKFTVKIAKKHATVTAQNQTAIFGDDFTLSQSAFTLDGVLDKDIADVVTTIECNYEVGNDKGTYAVTATATHKNYDFASVNGTLTVGAKKVVLDAKTYSVTYGEDCPELVGFTSDSVSVTLDFITLSTSYIKGEFANEYEVFATSSNANYTVDASKVKLVVEKRTLTLTLVESSLFATYGEEIEITYTNVGLLANDAKHFGIEYKSGDVCKPVPTILGAGSYEVKITMSDKMAQRYDLSADSVANGTLKVQKAKLNVGIDTNSLHIVFGEDANLVANYRGFVNGDDASALQGTLAFACDYLTQKHAGSFAISMSGLSADNYTISYDNPSLYVEKAAVRLEGLADQTTVYGQAFTPASTGCHVTYDDTLNQYAKDKTSEIVISVTCDYKQGDVVGLYEIRATGEHADFDVSGAQSWLTVNKADYSADFVNAEIAKNDLKGTYNPHTSLDAYKLSTGFAWANVSIVPTCDNTDGYDVTFCQDSTNYNVYEAKIKIRLEKAAANLRVDGTLEYDWSGSAISFDTVKAMIKSDNTDNGFVISVAIAAPSGVTEIKDGGVYTLAVSITETANYKAEVINPTLKVKAAEVNGVKYTVEDAVTKGGTVTLAGNAFIASNLTIPSGTTLILPSSLDSSTKIGTPTYVTENSTDGVNGFVDNSSEYIEHKLTVISNVNIIVNGNILVQGILGRRGQGLSGHTSNKHSQIIVDQNSTITFKSGATLDTRGYIKGTGSAIFESGSTLYSPFVVHDFRGGTSTVGSYNNGNIAPFSRYEMPNVQCHSTIYSGSTVTGYCGLWIGHNNEHKTSKITIIASSKALLNLTSGRIEKTYNAGTTTLNVYGDITGGSLTMKISVSILSATVDTSKVLFPLTYLQNINVISGTATVKYGYKLLPGFSINIATGATLNIESGGKIIAYDNSWNDEAGGGVGYYYPNNKGDAQIVVGGTVNVKSGGAIAGAIIGNANGSVALNSGCSISITSSEGYGKAKGTSFFDKLQAVYVETASIQKTATFKNSDNTTVNGEVGKTYTYNGTSWNAA